MTDRTATELAELAVTPARLAAGLLAAWLIVAALGTLALWAGPALPEGASLSWPRAASLAVGAASGGPMAFAFAPPGTLTGFGRTAVAGTHYAGIALGLAVAGVALAAVARPGRPVRWDAVALALGLAAIGLAAPAAGWAGAILAVGAAVVPRHFWAAAGALAFVLLIGVGVFVLTGVPFEAAAWAALDVATGRPGVVPERTPRAAESLAVLVTLAGGTAGTFGLVTAVVLFNLGREAVAAVWVFGTLMLFVGCQTALLASQPQAAEGDLTQMAASAVAGGGLTRGTPALSDGGLLVVALTQALARLSAGSLLAWAAANPAPRPVPQPGR